MIPLNLETEVTSGNIKIINSYKVTKKSDMLETLKYIQASNPGCLVFQNRSLSEMVREWRTHNIFWNLGIARSHTADVDINYPLRRIEKLAYNIIGWF